jgi:hypothetical protein
VNRRRRIFGIAMTAFCAVLCLSAALTAVRPITYSWGDPVRLTHHQVALRGNRLSYETASAVRPVNLSPGEVAQSNDVGGWDAWAVHHHASVVRRLDVNGTPLPGTYGNYTQTWLNLTWLLLLAVPFLSYVAARRIRNGGAARRRAASGLCPACGYDLRATPDRCPECGHHPAAT